LRGNTTKYILKESFRDELPAHLVDRDKMGFTVPISEWFRNELKDYTLSIFSERFFSRNLFNRTEVMKMLNAHLSGREEHAYRIWNLLCLELWFRRFID